MQVDSLRMIIFKLNSYLFIWDVEMTTRFNPLTAIRSAQNSQRPSLNCQLPHPRQLRKVYLKVLLSPQKLFNELFWGFLCKVQEFSFYAIYTK